MRLYLAVAMLMLAFVAYTEAQTADTLEERFSQFGRQMAEMGKTLADKAKTTFEDVQNSDFSTQTTNWFNEQLDRMKTKFAEVSQ